MSHASTLKPLLKRGALIAAANWPVVLFQFIAESSYKLLLTVPVIAAAFLAALIVGGNAVDLAGADVRDVLSLVFAVLADHPGALVAYLTGALVVLVGGGALTFLVKAGTVSVLVAAEQGAPPLEQPPLRLSAFRRAEAFSLERFTRGSARLFRPYLGLGLALMVVYGVIALVYLFAVLTTYRVVTDAGMFVSWPLIAAAISGGLVLAITVVNLLYLLTQIVLATEECGLRAAGRSVGLFLRAELPRVTVVFVAMLVIVGLATATSILATAGLGFIGFIPIVGLAVLPLQLAAWLARGVVFQYLGLTALCAYVRLYRGHRAIDAVGRSPMPAAR
jgi:hypothetical protein